MVTKVPQPPPLPHPGPPQQYSFQPIPQQPYYGQQFPPVGSGAPWPGGPPSDPRINGFAIAAFILSLLGGGLLSVIFGIVALAQVRRTGQAGRRLAIAGFVISALWTLGVGSAIAAAVLTSADRDEQGVITAAGDVRADSLRVGDCLIGLKGGEVSSVAAVPCGQPHEGEVFAAFDLPAGDFPGPEEVKRRVQEGCEARLKAYSTSAWQKSDVGLFAFYPRELNWSQGDRSVTCIVQGVAGAPLTGSVRGT